MNDPLDLDSFAKRAPVVPEKLTPAQDDQLHIAYALMLRKAPFFASLLLGRLAVVPTRSIPAPAATDEFSVFIHPDLFFAYTPQQMAFILAHEVMHCVWKHCSLAQKFQMAGEVVVHGLAPMKYSHELMNIATDLVINALLIDAKVGEFSKQWLFDPQYSAKGEESCVDVYAKLYKKNGGPGGGSDRFDAHMAPGEGSGKTAGDRNEADWNVAVAAAAATAKRQGALPAGIERLVGEIMNPKVSWQDHIRATMARRVGNDGYDWRRADRRLISRDAPIFFAAASGNSCGTIVLGVDTSGSIGDAELTAYFAEMRGIIEDMNPQQLYVIFCDAKVQRVDIIEDVGDLEHLRAKGAPGGGGTAFEPVFREVDKLGIEPDALVYLTDMCGSFPSREPSYPVIWAATTTQKPPFGDYVHVQVGGLTMGVISAARMREFTKGASEVGAALSSVSPAPYMTRDDLAQTFLDEREIELGRAFLKGFLGAVKPVQTIKAKVGDRPLQFVVEAYWRVPHAADWPVVPDALTYGRRAMRSGRMREECEAYVATLCDAALEAAEALALLGVLSERCTSMGQLKYVWPSLPLLMTPKEGARTRFEATWDRVKASTAPARLWPGYRDDIASATAAVTKAAIMPMPSPPPLPIGAVQLSFSRPDRRNFKVLSRLSERIGSDLAIMLDLDL